MSRPKTESHPVKSPLGNAVVGAPRILVADDDAVVVQTVSKALKRAGYAVTAVANGFEAWEVLSNQSFDLILTDEQMPGLTGHELILKARQHHFLFPIIVMSGQLDFFLNSKDKKLQVAQLLQKPFCLAALTDAIARALRPAAEVATRPRADRAQTAKPSSG